jgi:hypothetical protein
MDKEILKYWDKNNHKIKEKLKHFDTENYLSYSDLLKMTIEMIIDDEDDNYGLPSYKRIGEVDNGDYQGTLIYIIGGHGYQPSNTDHWVTYVYYGSCSGCDTLQAIQSDNDYDSSKLKEQQIEDYWTLCLHMVQNMKRLYGDNE